MISRHGSFAIKTIAVLIAASGLFAQGRVSVESLRCEYLTDPLGIDVEKPRLSWVLSSDERAQKQSAYRLIVASSMANLQRDRGDLWDSGRVNSDQTVFTAYAGRALDSGARGYWKVRVWDAQNRESAWSKPASWSMGLLRKTDWTGKFIGADHPSFPWLRKTVTLARRPQNATAYVNALGYYELYINGKKVDDHVLAPAVSDYSKRNYYVTHDVTEYLVAGKNSVAVWLGRGWYVKGHPGVDHDGPLVRMQIDGILPAGEKLKIASDATWKVRDSPLSPLGKGTAFGDYGGERYDASLELNDWNSASLDDSDWKSASVFDTPAAVTAAQMVQPNRIIQNIAAAKVEESSPKVFTIDMGRAYTGWFELRLPASTRAGETVRIEYADNLAAGPRFASFNQRDEYVTRQGPGQTIRSRFNYHAFRWARVTGLEQAPSLDDVKGFLIRTSYEPAGEFRSSNELLNKIYDTVTWTYQSLTMGGYVVDCPHRERLGYGGDAGTSMETGMYNFDVGGLYSKWSANWRDAQNPQTGDLPYTAPNYQDQGGGGPMWSGFSIAMPWQLYVQYGDKRILETSYPNIEKLLAFWDTKTADRMLEPYASFGMSMLQWNYLGDWVTPRRTPDTGGPRDAVATKFINNLYYLYNLEQTVKIANVLAKKEDAAKYEAKANALKRVLHERFFHADRNIYASGEQPYLAFPLLVNVVPENLRATVMKNLENTILVKNGGHVDAGMHGVYFMLRLLLQEDRNDLIFAMANKKTYPSWGNMLEQGATTIWESWSGGSRIHDTLISIGAWFTEGIGGIRADENSPGFRHFFIRPGIVGDLKAAHSKYNSIRGPIVSDWRIQDGVLHLDISVPPGTTATVSIPAAIPSSVTEGGRPAVESPNVKARGVENGKAVFLVESGRYGFASKL